MFSLDGNSGVRKANIEENMFDMFVELGSLEKFMLTNQLHIL